MSDAGTAGAAGATGTAAAAAAASNAASGGAVGNGEAAVDPALLEGEGEQTSATWPADWREKFAKGDEKKLAWYKRFASPENVATSGWNANERVRSGQYQPTLPEDASPEEIAAYRKQAGIPEKPEGYALEFPKDAAPTEADQADLAQYQALVHAAHMPPGHAKAAFDAFIALRRGGAQARYEANLESAVAAQAELRAEYGRDYPRYFGRKGTDGVIKGGLVSEFLAEHFVDDGPPIMELRLANGAKLGDDTRFARGILKMALAYAEDGALLEGAGDIGKSLDDQYNAAQDLQKTDRAKYNSAGHQALLVKLAEQRLARDDRQGRRAARAA